MNILRIFLFISLFFHYSLNACPTDCAEKSDTASDIVGKKQLKKYIVGACDLDAEDKSTTDKSIKLINKYVNKFKVSSRSQSADTLFEFVHSPNGQKLYRKAAKKNLVSIARVMKIEGVDINAQSKKSGNTPLIRAALKNHWGMVEFILEDAPYKSVVTENNKGRHLLEIFLDASVHKLLGAERFTKVLPKIIKNGHGLDHVEGVGEAFSNEAFELIANRCDQYYLDVARRAIPDDKYHPLRNSQIGQRIFSNTVIRRPEKIKMIHYLLSLVNNKGGPLINPNKESINGLTPLMSASNLGNFNTVVELLKNQKVKENINKLNTKRTDKWSAFTYAYYKGNIRTMEVLSGNGAKPILSKTTEAEERLQRELDAARRSNSSSGGGWGGGGWGGCDSGGCDSGGCGSGGCGD